MQSPISIFQDASPAVVTSGLSLSGPAEGHRGQHTAENLTGQAPQHRSSSITLSLSSPASRHRRPAHQPVQASPNIPHLGQQVPCHLVFVYLICPAPRIVRPASIYRIIVSLLQEAEPMRVKASLARSPPFSPLHQNSHSAVQGWRGGVRR